MNIELMVADEATAYTGLSLAELARKAKPYPFRATPGIVWYLFADITALRGQQGTERRSPEDGQRKAASAKPPVRQVPAGKIVEAIAAETARSVTATEDPALFDGPSDPYPIDPETEVEELSRLPKPELQTMAVELNIPEAAKLHRRSQIAQEIVAEKQRRHYAKQTPRVATGQAVAANVTPIRGTQGKAVGRRGTTGRQVVTAAIGGAPRFSDRSK